MKGIDLGLRNYYRVQPINIAGSCNNEMYPKTHIKTIENKKEIETDSFKAILDKCILEQKKKRY